MEDVDFIVEQLFLMTCLMGYIGSVGRTVHRNRRYSMFILCPSHKTVRHYIYNKRTGKRLLVGAVELQSALKSDEFMTAIGKCLPGEQREQVAFKDKMHKFTEFMTPPEAFEYIYRELKEEKHRRRPPMGGTLLQLAKA